jgi:hypothetical protein
MTNQEIALKLAWLRTAISKCYTEEGKKVDRSEVFSAHNAMNAVVKAIDITIDKHDPTLFRSDWRDALEIKLLVAESTLRAAAQAASFSLD